MAREIRILHTADTHLGYRQYHSEARRNDFFAAFELVVNDAVEMQVDALVHAGDLFDSRNPTLEDLLETMNILSRLKAADIPFFGIVGNHESKQNTQWLDLFEEMGLAKRLGKKPLMIGNVAIYGIDSVPKSKIPIFDYTGFEAPDFTLSTPSSSSSLSTPSAPPALSSSTEKSIPSSSMENCWNLLVMHQIMSPFPYAEWDCDEVLENFPFKIDAVLLGDYHEHSITKNKTGETWITYPGSTERNSTSEKEARSYNIITLSEKGLEISKRTIPTRKFLSIRVELTGEDKPYEQIFSAVNEYLEEIPESVVFLEISGDSGAVLSFSELEEYLLNKGALVPKVKDLRMKESFPEEILKVSFSDPDHAVASEIRKMSLNDGGLIIDEIVRSPNISRSRVDEETEGRLSKLIEAKTTDFKSPDFRIEIPGNPSYLAASPVITTGFSKLEEVESDNEVGPAETIIPTTKIELSSKAELSVDAGFAGKSRPSNVITGNLEITELSGVLRTSNGIENTDKKSPEASVGSLDSSGLSGSNSQWSSNSEPLELLDSGSTKLSNESIAPIESNFPQETSEIPEKTPETEIELWNNKDNEPEIKLEIKPESEPEKKIRQLSELGVKGKPEKATPSKVGNLPEEKPSRATELGKTGKEGQKKGKGKTAVPRQYNLGDYL
ncbi:MAG TPA: exonuclease SbcCD subunit D [Methanosarcina sp.]|jgi:DNA repair exonuclease SbcCD nuclease subunit